VQGEVEENIFFKRGENHRGDDSEIADIKREVVLKIRRLDDPVTNPKMRGAKQLRRQHPTDQFSTYCKDLYKRCINPKGCKTLGGENFFYADTPNFLRERCHNDPLYFTQIGETIRDKYSQQLGSEEFGLPFMDHICDVGNWRFNNPTFSPMSFHQRAELLEGRSAVHSEQSHCHSTMPLDQHPDYLALRAQANREAASSSGKGKSKGKGKEKGKDKGKWPRYRHGDNPPYS
jgi:hypothetical protein